MARNTNSLQGESSPGEKTEIDRQEEVKLPVTGPAWYALPYNFYFYFNFLLHKLNSKNKNKRYAKPSHGLMIHSSMHAGVYLLLVLNILASLAWPMYPYTVTNWMNEWLLEGAVSCLVYPTESKLTKLHWQKKIIIARTRGTIFAVHGTRGIRLNSWRYR